MAQDAQQKEQERLARIAEIEAQGGQNRATEAARYEPFEGGPRAVTDPATGRQITLNTMADYGLYGDWSQGLRQDVDVTATSELQQANNSARAELQEQMDAAAMERLDRGIQSDIDAATRQFDRRSEDYGERQTFHSQTTGKTYTWQTQEEFELVKSQIEQDNYIEAQRVIAGLRGTDPDSASKIREAYEFAKGEILWDPQTQSWRNLEDMSDEDLMATFMDAVDFYKLNDEERDTAYRLFTAFMERNPIEEQEDPSGGDGAGLYDNLPIAAGVADQGVVGAAVSPGVAIMEALQQSGEQGGALSPLALLTKPLWDVARVNTSLRASGVEVPEGVRTNQVNNESSLWAKLMTLIENQELPQDKRQAARAYLSQIEQPGYVGDTQKDTIEAFINSALIPTGPSSSGGM
jgi:hypothetical protein